MQEIQRAPSDILESISTRLIARQLLRPEDLERAAKLRHETGDRLDRILTKLGLVTDRDMAATLADCLALPLVAPGDYPEAPVLDDQISRRFVKQSRVIPLSDNNGSVALAMADPLDGLALQALQLHLRRSIRPCVGLPEEIDAAYERLYGGEAAIEQLADEFGDDATDTKQDVEKLRDLASEAPVIRLVNLLIGKAVELRASDIHIEPLERRLRVRYRVDGQLLEMPSPPERLRAAVTSRVKIMARLNIAESRLPQDGRIRLVIHGKEIDLRVSSIPTMHGEGLVLRILDRQAVALDFDKLGLEGEARQAYLQALNRPNGILLVTGPTGSGKTTTLYASLTHLNSTTRKILTVEDPIEYQLEGINQVQVKSQIGLTFAATLRNFLRQDPDIIMIGEIRDLETAQIAIQAALTGHLVLSTLHTNDAASTISRLIDMGIEEYLIASTVNGIVAQRLVRRLCDHCREAYEPSEEISAGLKLDMLASAGPLRLYRPKGCKACNDRGFRGRTTILETLVVSEDLRRLILKRCDSQTLYRAAVAEGMVSLRESGLRKALQGITSLEEVMRATQEA